MACICVCCSRTLYDSSPSYLSTCVRSIHMPWRPCRLSSKNQTSRPVAAFSHSAHENYTTWMLEHIAMLLVLPPMLLLFVRCVISICMPDAKITMHLSVHVLLLLTLYPRRLQLCDMLHVVGNGDKHKTECRLMPCISVCCCLTLTKHMS